MTTLQNDIDCLKPDLPSKCTYSKNNVFNNPHREPKRNHAQQIYPNILHSIGNTPLVKLNRIPQSMGIKCDVFVKCEFLNPGGSIKDRVACSMIEDAEERGLLKPGSTIIEPSSGNTGIALALASAVKGYRCTIVVPEKTSNEKVDIIKALGGQVVRVSDKIPYNAPGGSFSMPVTIQKETPNSVILNQYCNSANSLTHYHTTALEIYEQCNGKIDMLAVGVGTGGTLTGLGRKFKEILPNCVIVGVDPYGSNIASPESLNKTNVTYFEVEGIGHNYVPTNADRKVANLWVKVDDETSFNTARRLNREEGIMCGASSGAILSGALKAAKNLKEGQRCVVILPDGVGNYLTKFVSDYWMEMRNYIPYENTFNHWWWDYKVSVLDIKATASVTRKTTCQEALKIMNGQMHKILPVTNNDNVIEGIVSAEDLMKKMINSALKKNDPIADAISNKFKTVSLESTLGSLSRVLEHEGVAVVVDEELPKGVHTFKRLIFSMDLMHYVMQNNIQ